MLFLLLHLSVLYSLFVFGPPANRFECLIELFKRKIVVLTKTISLLIVTPIKRTKLCDFAGNGARQAGGAIEVQQPQPGQCAELRGDRARQAGGVPEAQVRQPGQCAELCGDRA
eukprot:440930-Prorocentrum_minimum.AAC.1